MQLLQDVLAKRGIVVTEKEAKQIESFYITLQHLKLDYDQRMKSTQEIFLTQLTVKGDEQ